MSKKDEVIWGVLTFIVAILIYLFLRKARSSASTNIVTPSPLVFPEMKWPEFDYGKLRDAIFGNNPGWSAAGPCSCDCENDEWSAPGGVMDQITDTLNGYLQGVASGIKNQILMSTPSTDLWAANDPENRISQFEGGLYWAVPNRRDGTYL